MLFCKKINRWWSVKKETLINMQIMHKNVYNHTFISLHWQWNENLLLLFIRTVFNNFQYVFWIDLCSGVWIRSSRECCMTNLFFPPPPLHNKQLHNVNYSKEDIYSCLWMFWAILWVKSLSVGNTIFRCHKSKFLFFLTRVSLKSEDCLYPSPLLGLQNCLYMGTSTCRKGVLYFLFWIMQPMVSWSHTTGTQKRMAF